MSKLAHPTFILIPGAGGMASYWQRLVPLLEKAGCEAIAVDLPADDPHAALAQYADTIIAAIGKRSDVILVAQSLGGFTAPLVCARAAVHRLIFINAMIPRPDETAGAWWQNTGAIDARIAAAKAGGYGAQFDVATYFLHDVPEAVLRAGPSRQREQAEALFGVPCRFARWPPIPIRVIASREDRFFPIDFQRRIARERLETAVEEVPGGHLVALSRPTELAAVLLHVSA